MARACRLGRGVSVRAVRKTSAMAKRVTESVRGEKEGMNAHSFSRLEVGE